MVSLDFFGVIYCILNIDVGLTHMWTLMWLLTDIWKYLM